MEVSFTNPPSTNPPSFFTKSAKSIGAGLVTSAGIFGSGISSLVVADVPPYKADAYLVGVSALSVIGGIYSAGKKFFSLSEKNCSQIILDSPQAQMHSLEKMARVIKNGLKAYGISFGLGLFGLGAYFNIVQPRWMHRHHEREILAFLVEVSALVGISTALHTHRSLLSSSNQNANRSLPNPAANGSLPSHPPTFLMKIGKSLGDGVAMGIGIFGTGLSGIILADLRGHAADDSVAGLSILSTLCGLYSAASTFSSLSETNSAPMILGSLQPPSQVKNHTALGKTARVLKSGVKAYGISFLSSIISAGIYHDLVRPSWMRHDNKQTILSSLVGISALVGLGSAVREYNSLSRAEGAPSLMERWRGTSTKKKACILAGSALAATSLGVLYIGPDKVVDKIKEVAQSIYNEARNRFYTSKTQTFSKTKREWVENYSDSDEIDRLINLPEDASCAEILFTCNIDPGDVKAHKIVWRDKLKKFHPDAYKGEFKVRAEKAAEVLNKASDIMKKTKQCPGKDDEGCYDFEDIIEITKTRKDPNGFAKAMGMEPICILQSGDFSAEVPIDQCSDVT